MNTTFNRSFMLPLVVVIALALVVLIMLVLPAMFAITEDVGLANLLVGLLPISA